MPSLKTAFARSHVLLFEATAGRVGGRFGRIRMLVLSTTGRTTGLERRTPLLYVHDGTNLVVVASNYGSDRSPAWYLNLMAHPDALVQVGSERRPVRARVATAEETMRLWPKAVAAYRGYDAYRAKAGRDIPMVILSVHDA